MVTFVGSHAIKGGTTKIQALSEGERARRFQEPAIQAGLGSWLNYTKQTTLDLQVATINDVDADLRAWSKLLNQRNKA